jgi:two-component system, sensor histidine kinase
MRKRILIADDDPMNVELLTYFLESNNFEVEAATDGNAAIGMGTSGNFDLVLLDVHMPAYDGIEVLHLLRKRFLAHPVKVIALTADLSDTVREALQSAGIDSSLAKPVDLNELRSEIDRLLPGSRQ